MNISQCQDFDVKVEGDVNSNSGDQYKTYNYGNYNTTNNGCHRGSRTRDGEYYDREQEQEHGRPGTRRRIITTDRTRHDRSQGHPYPSNLLHEHRAQRRRNRLDNNVTGPSRTQNQPPHIDTRGDREQRRLDGARAYRGVSPSHISPAGATGEVAAPHQAASTIRLTGPDGIV